MNDSASGAQAINQPEQQGEQHTPAIEIPTQTVVTPPPIPQPAPPAAPVPTAAEPQPPQVAAQSNAIPTVGGQEVVLDEEGKSRVTQLQAPGVVLEGPVSGPLEVKIDEQTAGAKPFTPATPETEQKQEEDPNLYRRLTDQELLASNTKVVEKGIISPAGTPSGNVPAPVEAAPTRVNMTPPVEEGTAPAVDSIARKDAAIQVPDQRAAQQPSTPAAAETIPSAQTELPSAAASAQPTQPATTEIPSAPTESSPQPEATPEEITHEPPPLPQPFPTPQNDVAPPPLAEAATDEEAMFGDEEPAPHIIHSVPEIEKALPKSFEDTVMSNVE